MDLRSIQKPLKDKYRSEPGSSRIMLKASSDQSDTPIACSVEVGKKIFEAQAHSGLRCHADLAEAAADTDKLARQCVIYSGLLCATSVFSVSLWLLYRTFL